MPTPDTPREKTLLSASDLVDETSSESFPASDPPCWSHMHSGTPAAEPADLPERRRGTKPDEA